MEEKGQDGPETETMSMDDYVDYALENPDRPEFGSAAEYLYEAITHYGTRSVVEEGEEKDRPVFFDDPWNNGEYAVLGNTEMLNDFVDSLRRIARNGAAKMPILEGETATGKSQLSNVLKQGLQHYSQTEEGRIHTVEIADYSDNLKPIDNETWKSFGNPDQKPSDTEYLTSPVQAEPLSVLKYLNQEAGEQVEQNIQERRKKPFPVNIPEHTGPVLSYVIDNLEDELDLDQIDLAQKVIDDYVQVRSFSFEEGKGIGEIQSEDEFDDLYSQLFAQPPMKGDAEDPRNWSFTGSFTAGNRGLAILDDADQYIGILEKLQSQIDENKTKFHGNNSTFSIDTTAVAISNPEDYPSRLPNSVYRRLLEFDMNYLTNYATETELIRKMMNEEWDLLDDEDLSAEDIEELVKRPLFTEVEKDEGTETTEYSPYTIQAAAMVEIASRMDKDPVPLSQEAQNELHEQVQNDLSLEEKIELYQRGYIKRSYHDQNGDLRTVELEKDDFEFPARVDEGDADTSLNVTFTKDVLTELNQGTERGQIQVGNDHIDLSNVVMPYDGLEALKQRVVDEETIQSDLEETVQERADMVSQYIDQQLEEDFLNALFERPGSEDLESYIDRVQALKPGEDDKGTFAEDGERKEPDEWRLKEIEKDIFGFEEDNYEGAEAGEKIEDFRTSIVNEIGVRAVKGQPNNAENLDKINEQLGRVDWSQITEFKGGEFENFDVDSWDEAELKPADSDEYETDTEAVKNRVIWNMTENGYTLPSAILSSLEVVKNKKNQSGSRQTTL